MNAAGKDATGSHGTARGTGRAWSRAALVALPASLTGVLVLIAFALALRQERERVRAGFVARASTLSEAVEARVDAHLEVLHSIASLYASSEFVTRDEFRTFTRRAFERHEGLRALSWNPIVHREERARVEQDARDEGLAGFEIRELAADGALVTAGDREEHACVLYIEPFERNAVALGFDVASDPARAQALWRARTTGRPSATGPIELVQESGEPGILVFLALPARASGAPGEGGAAVAGYATAAFVTRQLVETALRPLPRENMELRIEDVTGSGTGQAVWASAPAGSQASPAVLEHVSMLSVAGRSWRTTTTATPAYVREHGSRVPAVVLVVGAVVTGALVAFLLAITGKNAELEREVAERRRAQDALRQREEDLRQAQRLEAVGRLAGGVAHDFNNLLTVVMGGVTALRERCAGQAGAQREIDEVAQAAERAASLTRQLLAFGRRQALELTVVDLNAVVRGMETVLSSMTGASIRLVVELAPDTGFVLADRSQIEQVLLNLVANARDAMPRGGIIRIATSRADVPHPGTGEPVPSVELVVADTGDGIATDAMPHVFEPYFTTKSPDRGTGLGLATVHGIVTQSGGSIQVASEAGRGTSFRIVLPRCAAPAPSPSSEVIPPGAGAHAPAPVTGAVPPAIPHRATLLVVDDEPLVTQVCVRGLELAGFEVVAAGDGEEALRLAREMASLDLLVTDVTMPKMSGPELAARLRALRPDLPVLFMTGHAHGQLDADRDALPAGSGVLPKPFTPGVLVARVRAMLEADPAGGGTPRSSDLVRGDRATGGLPAIPDA